MRGRSMPYAIGMLGGLASGLLGIGGGVVVVPMLVAFLRLDQRRAHATSLAAILPASAVAAAVYASDQDVSWAAFLAIAGGAVVGAPLGVRILARAPERGLAMVFLGFAIVAGVRLLVA